DATQGEVQSAPSISDGTVYVGSADGTLYAYHLPS
ncbi:MAG TPA: PQQ-binding-like beta-propeller repeat protein, partial [Actinomycetota bacterium]|nr:PQQ-binding-like beta-propeller repeat protein [Actinomycetota bacterium]